MDKAKLNLKTVTIKQDTRFKPAWMFESAYNSHGEEVDPMDITINGTVSIRKKGDYPMIFTFTDPYTHQVVRAATLVSVV